MSSTPEEETVLLGTVPPSQKSQEAATLPSKHPDPANTPKPEGPVEWSNAPCPPALSAGAPRNKGDQSSSSRRTWCRSRSWCPALPVPAMTLMTGPLPTWWERTRYQVGGGSSGPSAIRVLGPSAMPKYKNWSERAGCGF